MGRTSVRSSCSWLACRQMTTRVTAALLAVSLLLASCSGSDDAGEAATTAAPTTTVAGTSGSTDPAWDDNILTDISQEQLADGCLQDARVLRSVGCTLASAAAVLLDPNPDLSPGQCPA